MNLVVALFLLAVALVYATVGQAGGTAFLAVMAVAGMPVSELRPTALALNIVAASYATWRLQAAGAIDWPMLRALALPALPASFIGGLVALSSDVYFVVTGLLLLLSAALMVTPLAQRSGLRKPATPALALLGGAAGLLSGLTGVGGGVFIAPALIVLAWTSPRQAAALSPPFILGNSLTGLAGALAAGQTMAAELPVYAGAALVGAAVGTMIGRRFLSERTTRFVLSGILLVAGLRLLTRG